MGPPCGPGAEGSKGSPLTLIVPPLAGEGGTQYQRGPRPQVSEGSEGKVLKMDGPSAQGFLSLTAFQAEGCGLPLCGNAYKVSVTGLAFWVRWHDKHYDDEPPSVAFPPLVPYGTTFPPRWEACHTILRSLCSLTNRVPLPPRYRSGDKRKAPLWAG